MGIESNFAKSLLKTASFNPESLQAPNAWVGHLPFASWIIQEVNPKIFVELGTHTGNSYFSFCQAVTLNSLKSSCYAIDTWEGDEHAGKYSDQIYNLVNNHNQLKYSHFSRLLKMTFDEGLSNFSDQSIDLLHIDGFHTYEAVKHDFETSLPKLAPGAVVLFHDTQVRERNFGVWKFWEELKKEYPANIEFTHSHGLGVIQLNNAESIQKIELLEWNKVDQQPLIQYFASIGDRNMLSFDLKVGLEKDQLINSLNHLLTERNESINALEQNIIKYKEHIELLEKKIDSVQNHQRLPLLKRAFKSWWL